MWLRRVHREDGFALASTIGILGVVTLLVVAILSATIAVTRQTRRDVGWNAALGAAEAGVQDFLFRLNSQPGYFRRIPSGDPMAPNPNEDTTNLAFTSFVPVPGASNGATFTYTADDRVTGTANEGRVLVTSTGAVGGVTRTIRATIRRDTFLDYVYAADYGTLDPVLYDTWPPNLADGESPGPAGDRDGWTPFKGYDVPDWAVGGDAVARASQECVFHRYDRDRPASEPSPWGDAPYRFWDGRHTDCTEIHFNAAIFDGPFHYNDMIAIRGGESTWNRKATTSWGDGASPPQVASPGYLDVDDHVNPDVGPGTPPVFDSLDYRTPFQMPPNNRELRETAALSGCVLVGPSRLVLRHSNELAGSGRVYVNSPGSGGRCGLSGSGEGELTLPPSPEGFVIYVEDGPAADCTGFVPPLGPGPDPSIEDYLTAMYPGDPAQQDITPYSCSAGDAYVEGELMGRLTIAAQHDIIVTWHLAYASIPDGSGFSGYIGAGGTPPAPQTDRDMLGMVADGQLRALKPTRCLYYLPISDPPCQHGVNIPFHSGPSGTIQDLVVYGALLTTQHSLSVDNAPMGGRLGRLFLVGTLAEKFASYTGTAVFGGTLGGGYLIPADGQGVYTCSDQVDYGAGPTPLAVAVEYSDQCRTYGGLVKQFIYDERVRYIEPPSFLAPDSVSWVQSQFEELPRPASLPPVPGSPGP